MRDFVIPGRRLGLAVSLLVLGLALPLAGCGDDSGELSEAERDELVETLVAEGASRDEAECFVDELEGDLGRLINSDEAELSEDDAKALTAALTKCINLG